MLSNELVLLVVDSIFPITGTTRVGQVNPTDMKIWNL